MQGGHCIQLALRQRVPRARMILLQHSPGRHRLRKSRRAPQLVNLLLGSSLAPPTSPSLSVAGSAGPQASMGRR